MGEYKVKGNMTTINEQTAQREKNSLTIMNEKNLDINSLHIEIYIFCNGAREDHPQKNMPKYRRWKTKISNEYRNKNMVVGFFGKIKKEKKNIMCTDLEW